MGDKSATGIASTFLGRRNLLQVAGVGALQLLSGASGAARLDPQRAQGRGDLMTLTIHVHADAIAEPLRLSMIGIRSMSEVDGFAESIPEMEPIGPSVVSLGVWFDGRYRAPPYPPAIEYHDNYSWASTDPTPWLTNFENALYSLNIVPLVQSAGAPPQFAETTAVEPAAHPAPTDMAGYTNWTRQWFDSTRHVPSVMVAVNNEPGHALCDFEITKDSKGNVILPAETKQEYVVRRRIAREVSSDVQADMLFGAASGLGTQGRMGLGAYISSDTFNINGQGLPDGKTTYFEGAVNAYRARVYDKAASFIAFNSFNGRFENDIFGRWKSVNDGSLGLPAVFTQYAPARVRHALDDPDGPPGALTSIGAAVDMLTDLERLSHLQAEAVCRAYWIGGKYALLQRQKDGRFRRTASWHALSFFASVPPRRVTVRGAVPTAPERASLGLHAIAGLSNGILKVLLWNDSFDAQTGALVLNGLPPEFAGATSHVQVMTGSDPAPRDLGAWSGSLTLPGESMAIVAWRVGTPLDPSARRRAMGANCLLLGAPMEIAPIQGGWAKWDAMRGLAQLYYQRAPSLRAQATFVGLPMRLYVTSFVDAQLGGRLRVWASFAGGPSKQLVFSRPVEEVAAGQVTLIDLAAFGGAGWAGGPREATLEVGLVDAQEGACVNVWFSERQEDALRLGTAQGLQDLSSLDPARL